MKKIDDFMECKLNYGVLLRTSFERIQGIQKLLLKQVDTDEIVYQDISADRMWIKKTSNEMNEGGNNGKNRD